MSSTSHTVYTCLKMLREQAKLTQEKLAKRVGTSRQTIYAIEKGDYVPSLKLALLISKEFKSPVEEVFHLRKKCIPILETKNAKPEVLPE